ncbi:twin-arginine translocation signal domain-containing protein [Ferrimonas marina]|uniref:Tat (Twin-arginine translocation) pathway signal sequence n=1 Tax=Ferrimonas marina TaxID=299255 RepID=A0A1M5ZPW5_9GAMM|nr:twin-arginine translocation signal domain-containing protein [Ferrimonas marina]SHI26169.1 Tat (twin-arginine translocation) pathway signal sequence [Ferrimonas marina]
MDRRQFLQAGLATGVALTLGVALWPTPEFAPQPTPGLSEPVSALFPLLIPVVLDGVAPESVLQERSATLQPEILGLLSTLPPGVRAQLDQIGTLLDNRLTRLALTGHALPMVQWQAGQQQAWLEDWRHHFLDTLKLAYQALRDPILAAWYGMPQHWGELAYQPPQLGREG